MLLKGSQKMTQMERILVKGGLFKRGAPICKDFLFLLTNRKRRRAWDTVKTEGKSPFSVRAVGRLVTQKSRKFNLNSFPNTAQNGVRSTKKTDQLQDVEKRTPKVEKIAILVPQGRPRGRPEAPKTSKNGGPKHGQKKSRFLVNFGSE